MSDKIFYRIFEDLLVSFFCISENEIEKILKNSNNVPKERIKTINDMKVIIYSNDHNPPHFHVKSNDLRINAKFLIENGELLSGEVSSKDLKRIKAFYSSPKTQILLNKIWQKKNL